MQLSQKQKILSPFFFLLLFHFLTLHSILDIFKKKLMTFIADVFLNLRTPKHVVR